MLISTNAIVISKLKYGDNDLIVKCYTQDYGTQSFLLRGVLKSKKGKVQAAYFQMLSQLQIVMDYKNNRSLQHIREVKLNHLYSSLHSNVVKSAVAMFLSEILSGALQEEEPNETLYSYIETTLLWFDSYTEYANFHLLFLLNLTKYLGFYPEVAHLEYEYFNLQDGKFELKAIDRHTISGDNVTVLKRLLETTFDILTEVKISSKQRQSFLNVLLLYYELHLGNFKKPKSLEILHQVFN
ncbi:DNA repair protein RecO [Flavobacteriaceae bacterium XHP0103]|uniref:DNA repair protein RecO n=1 Tax=Marixanthotalea marina TaxID=2844359 RepID=UPI002989DA11|nr:DNA repair protein RecO [Marixanthotalea marina]MBU3820788.1 DNA repair protein RecO [Marixanthotalea marina]